MEQAYYDIREPGSYGGVSALYRQMKSKGDGGSGRKDVTTTPPTKKQVREWLATQEAYTLHKPVRRRFPRRKVYARGPHYLWQADLADMNHLAQYNDGYRYLLTVIDVFTKYAHVVPIKKKDGCSVTEAFESIFNGGESNKQQPPLPLKLQTDKGKEFLNAQLQTLLKNLGIQFYTSNDDNVKASVVERFNRTLKTKMFKYLTHKNTHRFIDVLPDLLHSYNNTYHRTIGRAPSQVTADNAAEVYEKMYGSDDAAAAAAAVVTNNIAATAATNANITTTTTTAATTTNVKSNKLQVGDLVRLSNSRRVFDKGYLPAWTMELFKIKEVLKTLPTTYKIADFMDEPITGAFYDSEVQKVVKTNNIYKVEKILRTRGHRHRGNREMYVKWLGWPEKFSSWVREQDIGDVI